MTDAVVTRVGRETWLTDPGTLRVTRTGKEVWFELSPYLVTTRVGREIWIDHSAGYSSGRRRRVLVIASD